MHAFQKKNASNELNIFFLKKNIRGFFTVNQYKNKNQTKFNRKVKALHG